MPIDPKRVMQASYSGLLKAQQCYEEWTSWWKGVPESMATVYVSESISKLQEVDWVTPELNVHEALEGADCGVDLPDDLFPEKGRFDSVIWSGDYPVGVIEVKTAESPLLEDVERVCVAINSAPRIRWGLVAFILGAEDGRYKSGGDKLLDKIANLAQKAETVARDMELTFDQQRRVPKRFPGGDEGAWSAQVFEFRY